MSTRSPLWLTACLMAASMLIVVVAVPALASNFTSPYADSATHTYAKVNLLSDASRAVSWGMGRIDATDMNASVQSSCGSYTDVCAFDGDYESSGVGGYSASWWDTHYGLAKCYLYKSGSVCETWNVFFDTNDLGPYGTTFERTAGCHELGHTTGLEHRQSDSCMRQQISSYTSFNTHDKNHINGSY